MDRYRTPAVSLAEAYHVANRWMNHIGAVPERIAEPADGIVELRSSGMVIRIKFDRAPLSNSAVLALLKATDGEAVRRVIFSVTGFTEGAVSLGESRGFGLFDIDPIGDIHPYTTYARSLLADDPLEPAFLDVIGADDEPSEVPENPFAIDPDGDTASWADCPRCGITQHPKIRVCVSCGASMSGREAIAASGVTAGSGSDTQEQAAPGEATPVPPASTGGPRLRCRTCGSRDIELQH